MATKIYIDQGHNPQSPNAGAEANGLREQDLVYRVGQEWATILRAQGFDVRLSRPTPETQIGDSNASSLQLRVADANAWGADYFISLHTNAALSPDASGTEAFVFSRGGESERLGEELVQGVSDITGLRNRGVFPRPSLYVLRRTDMPAALVELGFISNPGDAALLRDQPRLFAQGLDLGLRRFLGMT